MVRLCQLTLILAVHQKSSGIFLKILDPSPQSVVLIGGAAAFWAIAFQVMLACSPGWEPRAEMSSQAYGSQPLGHNNILPVQAAFPTIRRDSLGRWDPGIGIFESSQADSVVQPRLRTTVLGPLTTSVSYMASERWEKEGKRSQFLPEEWEFLCQIKKRIECQKPPTEL